MSYTFHLETPRLILREMRESDAFSFFLLNEDPEVMRYTGDERFKNEEDSRQFLENYPNISYLKDGYGRWTCINKQSGETLGWCGLRLQKNGKTDLGYRFHKRFWNQGFASEAGLFSLATGFNELKLNSIIATADEKNIASWKVMEKLNMKFSHKEKTERSYDLFYRILASEFTQ
jgi:[ribosomal protein S5]-alanine N-acetyltransferase